MPIVAFASDHAGVAYKAMLIDEVRGLGHGVLDLGPATEASVDYPDYGAKLADAIAEGRATLGVAICGSGIGIAIAANRNPAVRAAVCTSGLMARLARQHNDANVLALGSRIIGPDTARDCLSQFLAAGFAGGRHTGRVAKLTPGYQETPA
jgi:ribose 5-phosphate isomerase B